MDPQWRWISRGEEMALPQSRMTTDERGRSTGVVKSSFCLHDSKFALGKNNQWVDMKAECSN